MSQIRLYVDEDAAAFALVEALRHRGVDVVTVLDAGMASATDEQQLVIATSQGRAIYSHNVGDFCRLHREFLVQSRQHAGIILTPANGFRSARSYGDFCDLSTQSRLRICPGVWNSREIE